MMAQVNPSTHSMLYKDNEMEEAYDALNSIIELTDRQDLSMEELKNQIRCEARAVKSALSLK